MTHEEKNANVTISPAEITAGPEFKITISAAHFDKGLRPSVQRIEEPLGITMNDRRTAVIDALLAWYAEQEEKGVPTVPVYVTGRPGTWVSAAGIATNAKTPTAPPSPPEPEETSDTAPDTPENVEDAPQPPVDDPPSPEDTQTIKTPHKPRKRRR